MALALSHYSFTDRQKLWIAQGGNPRKSIIAAAVSMAENVSGDPNATHRNSDGSVDVGLWQINSVHGAQATRDPAGNARAAIAISKNGTDWRPWTTFRSGAYLKFMAGHSVPQTGTVNAAFNLPIPVPGGPLPIPGAPGVPTIPLPDNVPLPTVPVLGDVNKFFSRLEVVFELDWWKRVGLILGGAVAILLGVLWFGKEFLPKDLPIPPIPIP